jgi:pyridoxine 5-phosphate synthase
LNYHNVGPVAAIEGMRELNIGHALVSRALFIGIRQATAEMKRAMKQRVDEAK